VLFPSWPLWSRTPWTHQGQLYRSRQRPGTTKRNHCLTKSSEVFAAPAKAAAAQSADQVRGSGHLIAPARLVEIDAAIKLAAKARVAEIRARLAELPVL
jgi:hypothetical protein